MGALRPVLLGTMGFLQKLLLGTMGFLRLLAPGSWLLDTASKEKLCRGVGSVLVSVYSGATSSPFGGAVKRGLSYECLWQSAAILADADEAEKRKLSISPQLAMLYPLSSDNAGDLLTVKPST